ncbi:class I SAM-dependent methyltransferase [Echinicola jeungdonensis]|uniref:Class I SAM-dependent methyltransferase n=1 Tax=Echinicola jeungdonensis TaxID=709343 RepID=A0ABV5J7K8_9BACT|nr:class I SAM-dependent methyltransferase [Echinicola jeungdonensis]MDN3668634.1 class I SAM-dependent methyltransferase [Echinicola jeungdonensis]
MKNKELDIFEEIIKAKKPNKVLEWGSGFSTLYFPSLHSMDLWISVEHDKDWAKAVGGKYLLPYVEIHHVPSEIEGWNNQGDWKIDGTYEEFETYVNYPEKYKPFDLIIIDGRARVPCLRKAKDLLAPKGIIIFHDCNREHYHQYQSHFKFGQFITDHRKEYGGLWVGSKDIPLENLVNVKRHLNLWKLHSKLSLMFKF